MKFKKFYVTFLIALLNASPPFMSAAYSQAANTDYGVLLGIVPELAKFTKSPLYLLPKPNIPISAPTIPNPTQPIAITSTPSAPGKYPLVRWLLPGGPPPTQTPILPPLTCNYDDC